MPDHTIQSTSVFLLLNYYWTWRHSLKHKSNLPIDLFPLIKYHLIYGEISLSCHRDIDVHNNYERENVVNEKVSQLWKKGIGKNVFSNLKRQNKHPVLWFTTVELIACNKICLL